MPDDQKIYRLAELNGMAAWTVSIVLNVAKSVPGGDIPGAAGQMIYNQIKAGGDVLAFTEDLATEGGDVLIPLVLDYAYETRARAGSLLRTTAHYGLGDGRKIKLLGVTAKYLSALFKVPQYLTDLWFVVDTLLAPTAACYVIDGGSAEPFDPWAATAFPLNDTGIDWCADGSRNNLPCPVAGYPGQDGEVGRDVTHDDDSDGHAGFSFTKLDASGNPLPTSASNWSCVRDNVTGLIWEIKTDDGGLRDKDWTYSWYNPDGTTNGGAAGYADFGNNCANPSRCDTQKFVADVNATGLCGARDWRLPAADELSSIVSNDRVNPSIDTGYFPNTRSNLFWSSSPGADSSSAAWYVNFTNGYVNYSRKDYQDPVRLVRGGQ